MIWNMISSAPLSTSHRFDFSVSFSSFFCFIAHNRMRCTVASNTYSQAHSIRTPIIHRKQWISHAMSFAVVDLYYRRFPASWKSLKTFFFLFGRPRKHSESGSVRLIVSNRNLAHSYATWHIENFSHFVFFLFLAELSLSLSVAVKTTISGAEWFIYLFRT